MTVAGLLVGSLVACGFADDDGNGAATSTQSADSNTDASTKSPVANSADTTLKRVSPTTTSRNRTAVASLLTTSTSASGSTSTTSTTSTAPATATTSATIQPANAVMQVTPISSESTYNSLDTIVSDMSLRNDFVMRGYEHQSVGWYTGPGYNMMGNIPNTDNTPWYFKNSNPSMLGITLRAILPLLVLFDGTQHTATNTRVHMRNMRLYIKSKSTGQWQSIGVSPGVSGYNTPKATLFAGSEAENKRTNSDGSVEIKPPGNSALAWHGWWNIGRTTINPYDVDAVFVTMQARLTVDNPALPDDRGQAELGIHIGADYYVDTATSWSVINPAVMLSRTKRITNNWQSFNAMTFSDVGVQEPGGGISQAAFRAAPPPLE